VIDACQKNSEGEKDEWWVFEEGRSRGGEKQGGRPLALP
jgi:hypothetical protein